MDDLGSQGEKLVGPNLETCPFWEVQICTFGGPNLEICAFWEVQTWNLRVWGVQTWKPVHFGRSKPGNLHAHLNLEIYTFGGSKPGNLHVLGGPNLETCPAYPEIGENSGAGTCLSGPRDHII